MTTTIPSAALVPTAVFTEPERLALAGFLASHTGLTREATIRDTHDWCSVPAG